jgi:hypothetical protein
LGVRKTAQAVNDMGRKQYKAGPAGREKQICCVGDLLWVIEGEEE